ncbi:hypothetical protein LCL97_02780 [Seohaeicola saemankumensis]|nr:hypothetical protein [Seohaeicola saemankumensis]MCA0869739.1 hypothetical protein [Seohaeicola saemankumensis]
MTRMIPLVFCGAALVLQGITPAAALPARSFERAEVFATCSGRLAALATRQRALRDAGAHDSQRLASLFDMLLDATMPDAIAQGVPVGQGTLWRSRGWGEMAGLLADLDRGAGGHDARRAVQSHIDDCRDLVLPRS